MGLEATYHIASNALAITESQPLGSALQTTAGADGLVEAARADPPAGAGAAGSSDRERDIAVVDDQREVGA